MLYESQYYGIVNPDLPYISHHGVKGQKWGKRQWQYDDGSLTPAGYIHYGIGKGRRFGKREAANNTHKSKGQSGNKSGFKLSDKQKTALKIGAAVVVAGLAVYGGYKLSQTDAGKQMMGAFSKGADLPDIGKNEPILERMAKVNPAHHEDNCLPSAIAGQARLMGKDVTAQGLNKGNKLPMDKALKKCFDGAQILTDNPNNREMASRFAKSRADAEKLLVEKFGQNASGVIGVNWTKEMGGGGHAFNFQIFNGHVVFSDYQNSFTDGHNVLNNFWNMNAIDGNKYICLAKLDGSTLKKGVTKFVSKAA